MEILRGRTNKRSNWLPLGTVGRWRREGKERLWLTATERMTWSGSGRRMRMFLLLFYATYIQSVADKAEIVPRFDIISGMFCSLNSTTFQNFFVSNGNQSCALFHDLPY